MQSSCAHFITSIKRLLCHAARVGVWACSIFLPRTYNDVKQKKKKEDADGIKLYTLMTLMGLFIARVTCISGNS